MTKKIIFTAGGTGGHIFPAINLMKHFFARGYEVILVTDIRGKKFIKNYPEFKFYILTAGTPTNKKVLKKFLSIFLIIYSIIKSIIFLKKEKANLIFGFGGYVSFPISFSSMFFKIPLAIYENNMVLGRANKHLLKISQIIFTSKMLLKYFPIRYSSKICEVGPILEKKIINYDYYNNNKNKDNLSILVLGGSQGAEIFGKIIPQTIKMLKDKGLILDVKQQCLEVQKKEITDFYIRNNIKNYVFTFDKDILKLISSSNLAITRCGASTTAELAYTLTPFIAVPLPNSIDNHQFLNAKYYEQKGCCWILEQNSFSAEILFDLIIKISNDKNNSKNVKNNLEKICNKNVYSDIENKINEIIQK